MLKKLLSLVCGVATSFCVGTTNISAENISPYSLYLKSTSSELSISNSTATCTSGATGYSGTTTKINIVQTLEVKGFAYTWIIVDIWSETDTGYRGNATNTKSNLPSGTYRLKSVFTAYSGNNSEEITAYSTEENA
ncbi:MAG: hypothetical protein J6A58_02285 [Oscillospiraceae bacterium]|nr:hypothetical protein [Oscillospiraceae bacterium]